MSTNMKRMLSLLATVGVAIGFTGVSQGQTYRVRDIGPLEENCTKFVPQRVTELGQVVGLSKAPETEVSAVPFQRWRSWLWTPEAFGTLHAGMNDNGQAAGPVPTSIATNTSLVTTGRFNFGGGYPWTGGVAYTTSRGVRRNLGALTPGAESAGLGINGDGEVVGSSQVSSASFSACVPVRFTDHGPVELPRLQGFVGGRADGINDRGVIVGSVLAGSLAGWGRFEYEALPLLYITENSRAVVWRNGEVIDLNTLLEGDDGWTIRTAKDVANNGQIVGTATDAAGRLRIVLLSPVIAAPDGEPATAERVGSFVGAYFDANIRADVDGSGTVETSDLFTFVDAVILGDPAIGWAQQGHLGDEDSKRTQLAIIAGSEGLARGPVGRASGLVFDDSGCDSNYARAIAVEGCFVDCSALEDLAAWKSRPDCWNVYNKHFNPLCRGCPGTVDRDLNPHAPNGAPGWDANDVNNPYYPGGGPGGPGAPATPTSPAGNGGKGGFGYGNGAGGDGGDGGFPGGHGGDGGAGGPQNGPGGNGGHGGAGGDSQPGGNGGNGGAGGGEGAGGDGGAGGPSAPGEGQSGGNGGNGGTGGRHGGPGGNGGAGGEGDGSKSGGAGGEGGQGGSGRSALPSTTGGPGGRGGEGGQGGRDSGCGGRGGNGGTGGEGHNRGGDPGVGGPGGQGGNGRGNGSPAGNGGNGGHGGTSDTGGPGKQSGQGGNGGSNLTGPGPGGAGGAGGNGGNGAPGGPAGGGGNGGPGVPYGPGGTGNPPGFP